ncbi:MAG: hypothetical protein JO301_09900 [Chitinophagaceae bacterium]|nr:hypothetical protein [Chitinophagaceae bacterium]
MPSGKILYTSLLFAGILICSYLFRNQNIQAINWTYPYCSGAANLDMSFQWKVGTEEYDKLVKLPEAEYKKYRHQRSSHTILNQYNNFGYVIIVFIARNIFFEAGDLNAVIYLQIIIHALTVILIVSLLKTRSKKLLFIFLYGLNPFIIHFVTFPFYYFWTVIPCYLFCWFYLKRKTAGVYSIVPVTLLLYLSLLIRPTTVLVIVAVYVLLFLFARGRQKLVVFLGFLGFATMAFLFDGKPKNPEKDESTVWHTAFIGFGAYPNSRNIEMKDSYLYDRYFDSTKTIVSSSPITGTFQNVSTKNAYFGFAKNQYLSLLKEEKIRLLRNASLNMLEAFSYGYIIDHKTVTYASIFVGLFIIGYAIYRRYYALGICIFCYAATYTPFYPPIPAYHFGAFLVVFILVTFLGDELLQAAVKASGRNKAR